MIEHATRIHCNEDLSSTQRIAFRLRMLQRLTSQTSESVAITNPRDNGFFGEQVVFEMKLLRDNGTDPDEMVQYFRRFQPYGPEISTREQRVKMEGEAVIGRAFKNKGHYDIAATWYRKVFSENLRGAKSCPGHEILASWAEVLCELKQTDAALAYLRDEVRFFRDATGGKLLLTTAHALLMQTLFRFKASRKLDKDDGLALAEAGDLYNRYLAVWRARHPVHLTIINKTNLYTACAGIAMGMHVSSLFPDKWSPEDVEKAREQDDALAKKMKEDNDACVEEMRKSDAWVEKMQKANDAWGETKASARQCWPTPGYTHMIATYSQCELLYRMGRKGDADELRREADVISQETHRQHYFIAQGTVWVDLLEEQADRERWDRKLKL